MNYEEKYRKLVEAIKVMRDVNPSDEGLQNWVQDNVPELAERRNSMIFQLDIPIYNTNVLFIINPVKDEMDEFLNNENNKEKLTEEEFTNLFKELDDKRYGGYTTALDKGGYLILIKEGYKDFTIFIHELFHVANLILFDREVEYSRAFEPLAYLLGWMTQQYADYVLWKPSEEQLTALQAVNSGCSYDTSALTSLLDDLKDITI